MSNARWFLGLAAVAGAAGLAGCVAPPGYYQAYPAYSAPAYSAPVYAGYPAPYQGSPGYALFGSVLNVELMRGSAPTTNGAGGALAGAVIGGVIGNQFGGGSGRALATAAGVVGGAMAGSAIEQNANRRTFDFYRVTVQFDNGALRAFDYAQPPDVQIGDRVRAEGNQLYR